MEMVDGPVISGVFGNSITGIRNDVLKGTCTIDLGVGSLHTGSRWPATNGAETSRRLGE
jgi:hypothetical protein